MSDIRRLHERIADLEVQLSTKMGEIARLANENADLKEFDRTKPDAEWREMYEDISKSAGYQRGRADRAEAELSEAKAEIEWLRDAVDELLGEIQGMREAALKPDMPRQYSIGELAAAVTLAKANLVGGPELDKQFKAYVEAVEAVLKPDTGE